ncbi:MAG: hypothetical protein ACJ8DC_01115 [Gemmatimonadales bacterium]
MTWSVPELGPSLGRLGDPALIDSRSPLGVTLDDVRLDLVTGVFDLAGAGRAFATAGDRDRAVASLGRAAWLQLWERAVDTAASRISGAVNAHFGEAAGESRFPPRRLRALLLTDDDTRAIAARLGSGGAPFVTALDALEQSARSTDWQSSLTAVSRRLESAWRALEAAAAAEQQRWHAEIELVRSWRRSTWPIWSLTGVIFAGVTYLGLVLGGYITVPVVLRGFAAFWWSWP